MPKTCRLAVQTLLLGRREKSSVRAQTIATKPNAAKQKQKEKPKQTKNAEDCLKHIHDFSFSAPVSSLETAPYPQFLYLCLAPVGLALHLFQRTQPWLHPSRSPDRGLKLSTQEVALGLPPQMSEKTLQTFRNKSAETIENILFMAAL